MMMIVGLMRIVVLMRTVEVSEEIKRIVEQGHLDLEKLDNKLA
jgi:hypothetical protein